MKYPILKPNEVIAALSKKGFYFSRHAKYTNDVRNVIIPMHDTLARGTLKSILLQANIELEDFLGLL